MDELMDVMNDAMLNGGDFYDSILLAIGLNEWDESRIAAHIHFVIDEAMAIDCESNDELADLTISRFAYECVMSVMRFEHTMMKDESK
jgi:hypothetical protein